LIYCGYIGGGWGRGIAVDSAGCAHVTGYSNTEEASLPVIAGPDLTRNDKRYGDAFVAKVNAAGTAFDYCGYIGGNGNDYGYGIAVDSAGCAYVTGCTRSYEDTFPVTMGPDLTHNGDTNDNDYYSSDAFVAKVDASGTALIYCGYIGGLSFDAGYGIAVDYAGCAYVTGCTYSFEDSFPVTVGPDLTHNGNRHDNSYYLRDAFVAKVNETGTHLDYCGYIGGRSFDEGNGISVDYAGCAYVIGFTGSSEDTFPVTVGPDLTFDPNVPKEYDYLPCDAFVAKIYARPYDTRPPWPRHYFPILEPKSPQKLHRPDGKSQRQ
ncbi:MAG: SBBP repeat-containing protein, partial [Candidatus Aminicenantes bacterium]|nr:SBBP repeat-containing protein [Candidatus Aminicenantes bacterium]